MYSMISMVLTHLLQMQLTVICHTTYLCENKSSDNEYLYFFVNNSFSKLQYFEDKYNTVRYTISAEKAHMCRLY
jgi:hypothetical protein